MAIERAGRATISVRQRMADRYRERVLTGVLCGANQNRDIRSIRMDENPLQLIFSAFDETDRTDRTDHDQLYTSTPFPC